MQRQQAIDEIISYFQSDDYLCDIYNDYSNARLEMCEEDFETEHSYVNRRSKADAQREAHKQGFHLRDEELDFYFPSFDNDVVAFTYPTEREQYEAAEIRAMYRERQEEDDDLPF